MTAPAYIKSWLDAIQGDEKFIIVVGAGLVNTLLLIGHFVDQSTYATMFSITVGAYITGKTVENVQITRSSTGSN